jgi:subfamily B ATP-binding cassette protein MsbA
VDNHNLASTVKRLAPYLKPYQPTITVGVLAMFVIAATEASLPLLIQPFVDGSFIAKDPDVITKAPFYLVALFAVRGIATILSTAAFASISTKFMNTFRKEMYSTLIHLPQSFYSKNTSGGIVTKFTYDVTQLSRMGVEVFSILIRDSLTVIGLLAYLFWLNWKLSLLTLILMPLIGLMIKTLLFRQKRLSKELQSSLGDMTHIVDESYKGQTVIKIYEGFQQEISRFTQCARDVMYKQYKLLIGAKIGLPVIEFSGAIIMAMVIFLGVSDDRNSLSVGEFVSFFTALGLLFSPLKRLTKVTNPISVGLAAAESVFNLLDHSKEITKSDINSEVKTIDIALTNVSFKYPSTENYVLSEINILIPQNSALAIVGPSGSGKSTFASLLPGLNDEYSGSIKLGEKELRTIPKNDLRRKFSIVDQNVHLFNDTVKTNIAYGINAESSIEEIIDAAKEAGAHDFISELPQGYDTPIGENGSKLSGGQRQRIAIARALLKKAPILIFDEATSALDSETENIIQNTVSSIKGTRTIILIAHRLSTLKDMDTIIAMKDGKIVECGSHEDLIRTNGTYSQLYQAQLMSE